MHSSQATVRGSLSSRRIPQLEKVSLASKMVTSAKSVSPDVEAVKKKQEEEEEEEKAFADGMHKCFMSMHEQIGSGVKDTDEKFAALCEELQKQREHLEKDESYLNSVLWTKADEANPELLKRALTIVYDAVTTYVDSLQSMNQQVPGGVDWRLEEAKTSDGHINAEILMQKLWEFLKLEHDPIQRTELAWLSQHFCRKLVNWAKLAEDQLKSTKECSAFKPDIDLADDQFHRLKQALQCFLNNNGSIKILSFLVFAPKTSGSETEHKVVAMKDLHDSHQYRGDAHDFKARCDDEHGNELIEDQVRQAKSNDQILDDRNRSSLILTQANTDGDSDDGSDGSDGSDAETSNMYVSDKSESSTLHSSSPEVHSLYLGLEFV
ncbi:hypothetical protein A7U60_g1538 [Sanghuangporus baumii]|uniref:Uncharacterized protein n=1 Tax=Sanghuangporus baumii TaxID=108892 RepID=A0A9Q5NBK6_SANBA|nr:hypothetical protein A7U60_g1538 [Sanghuangporus baumii]